MKIHLVGGFLGSGKTTAIANSCKILADREITTGVITNDQGEYLVDSRFIKHSGIATSEVTGGCFCCNYNQLDSQISTLKSNNNPSAIFAEFVGSCTDLAATVLKPLIEYRAVADEQVTFSSFVDANLFLMYLEGKPMPFSMETNYIWEKQIEEAEILVVNKTDLLSSPELEILKKLTMVRFSSKEILFQNSLDDYSLCKWIELISMQEEKREHRSIEIDYAIYGKGEANLAWLDEEIEIVSSDSSAVEIAHNFINKLTEDIAEKKFTIGHLKYFLSFNDKSVKISHTTVSGKKVTEPVDYEKCGSVNLLINARIQTSPEELRNILFDNLNIVKARTGTQVNEKFLSYFRPGFPNPTHRLA